MNELPFCSVVIPAYNCENFIKQTIESVLDQTHRNLEVIIVNDCSTDRTVDIILIEASTDERIKVFCNEKNIGVADTRMRGVKEAKSQYIAFLDSDDIWETTKLEKQLAFMMSKNADITYTGYNFIDAGNNILNINFKVRELSDYKNTLKQNHISSSTIIIKKDLIIKYPMERSDLVEDVLCWLKILREGYYAHGLQEKLVSYRLLNNSRSSKKLKIFKKYYLTLRYLGIGVFYSVVFVFINSINTIKKYKTKLLKKT